MSSAVLYHLSMLGAILDLALLAVISRRRVTEGVGVFRLLLGAVILWVVGDANAWISSAAWVRRCWLWVEFAGRPLAPPLWLLFALRYTRTWTRPERGKTALLFALPVTTVALAWTNDLHGLVWSPAMVHLHGATVGAMAGPWFRWVQLPFAWLMVAGGCLLIAARGLGGERRLPLHPWLFLAIGVPPLVVSIAGLFSERVRATPGLAPLAFVVGAGPLLYGIARSPVFGLSLLTYRNIFESIGDAVLVVDDHERVIDLNRAAQTLFGFPKRVVPGRALESLLPPWNALRDDLGPRGEMHREVRLGGSRRARTFEVDAFALHDRASSARRLLLVRDVSSRRAYEQRIEHLAYHDPLTGLPNRRWLETAGSRLLGVAAGEGREAAVLFVDLDDFKDVNDTLGHAAGDDLLLEVAKRFRATLRSESVLVRLGGDEFAVLIRDCDGACSRAIGARLLEALQAPCHPAGSEVWVGASVGAALYPRHGSDMATLLRRADVAMYAAKRSRGRIEVYDPESDFYTPDRLRLQSELHRALHESDQLRVHYQPIVDAEQGRVVAVEALVRWQHPERGFLEPEAFLPMAENARLIPRLDRWVLRRALRDWKPAAIQVAVNVHPRTLADPEYVNAVAAALAETGFPAHRLVLEITERALTDPDGMRGALTDLAALGVGLMADDYGTGQSSLIYIRRFPFDGLKIHRTLASGIGRRREDEAIVEAVVGLARQLGLRLVVEGVESQEAVDWLRARHCAMIQGHALGRARPLEELVERRPDIMRPHRLLARVG